MIPTRRRSGVPLRIVTVEKTETWRIAATKTSDDRLSPVEEHYLASGFLTRTITASSVEKSTKGSIWICL